MGGQAARSAALIEIGEDVVHLLIGGVMTGVGFGVWDTRIAVAWLVPDNALRTT